jgi:hypothetical protein
MSDMFLVKLREARVVKIQPPKTNRRGATRFLCSDIVQLLWHGPDGLSRREVAVLENLSRARAGLFMGVPVPQGTEAQLFVSDAQLTGQIKQCAFAGNGYMVEIKLASQSKWARMLRDAFVPEHLLDISLLDLD